MLISPATCEEPTAEPFTSISAVTAADSPDRVYDTVTTCVSGSCTTESTDTEGSAVAAKALPSVVSVYVESSQGAGLGSGAVLDTDGNVEIEGMKGAWDATKSWSTNAWEATKHGVETAVDATKDAAESARIGIVEFFGGVDAPKKAESLSTACCTYSSTQ